MSKVRRGALFGAAFSAWCIALLALYKFVAESSWFMGPSLPRPNRAAVFQILSTERQIAAVAVILIAPIILVCIWSYVEQRMQLDPESASTSALLWSVRALGSASFWIFCVVLMLLIVLAAFLAAFSEYDALSALPFTLMVLLSLGMLSGTVISADRPKLARPEWPGPHTFVTVVLCLTVAALFQLALAWIGALSNMAGLFIWPVSLTAGTIMTTAAIEAVAFRMNVRTRIASLPQLVTRRRLGPLLALEARVIYIGAALAVPVLITVVFLWKDVPVAASWLFGHGQAFPIPTIIFIHIAQFLGDFGVGPLTLVSEMLTFLALGRLAWLTIARESIPAPDPGH